MLRHGCALPSEALGVSDAMRRVVLSATVLVALIGGAVAGTAEQAPGPKCRKAEINPVTGNVFCIDPLGAPVEAPPDAAKPPCRPEDARGQWSYGPACSPEPRGD
jgi:hypothetical protein